MKGIYAFNRCGRTRNCVRCPRRLTPEQRARRSGQALIETFGVMILLCILLFAAVQYTLIATGHEVIQHGADAGARARAVGFNRFMVRKVVQVATIPNAGRMTQPQGILIPAGVNEGDLGNVLGIAINARPSSAQYDQIEALNIPLYLGAENYAQLPGLLDYEEWDTISFPSYFGTDGETVGVRVRQEYEIKMPFVRGFWLDGDHVDLEGDARLADHSSLYLE